MQIVKWSPITSKLKKIYKKISGDEHLPGLRYKDGVLITYTLVVQYNGKVRISNDVIFKRNLRF